MSKKKCQLIVKKEKKKRQFTKLKPTGNQFLFGGGGGGFGGGIWLVGLFLLLINTSVLHFFFTCFHTILGGISQFLVIMILIKIMAS